MCGSTRQAAVDQVLDGAGDFQLVAEAGLDAVDGLEDLRPKHVDADQGQVPDGRLGNVVIEAGAVVERSVIRGPAIIGGGARIVKACIGPFTAIFMLGDNSEVGIRW